MGAGAQGRTVLVQHVESGRVWVLKYVARVAGIERFREESTLLRRVNSPYVARWFGHYENDARTAAAIAMEAVDGVSLRAILDSRGPMEPAAALALLSGALRGLADAHAHGVLHRDYKPGNVVVRGDGVSKLIDFGIAVLTGAQGARTGTPPYMAPEQWQATPPAPATDVYAVTCVFYECLTGDPPYGRDAATLPQQHLSAPIPTEAVPPPLRPLIERGMAKHPADRPQTAAALLAELQQLADQEHGPDWEQRGRGQLAAAAQASARLSPLAGLLTPAISPDPPPGPDTGAGASPGGAAGTPAPPAATSSLLDLIKSPITLIVPALIAVVITVTVVITNGPDNDQAGGPPGRPVGSGLRQLTVLHPDHTDDDDTPGDYWGWTLIDLDASMAEKGPAMLTEEVGEETVPAENPRYATKYRQSDLFYHADGLRYRIMLLSHPEQIAFSLGWVRTGHIPDTQECTVRAQSRGGLGVDLGQGMRAFLHRAWCQSTSEGKIAYVRVDKLTPTRARYAGAAAYDVTISYRIY